MVCLLNEVIYSIFLGFWKNNKAELLLFLNSPSGQARQNDCQPCPSPLFLPACLPGAYLWNSCLGIDFSHRAGPVRGRNCDIPNPLHSLYLITVFILKAVAYPASTNTWINEAWVKVITCLIAVTKIYDESNLRKQGFISSTVWRYSPSQWRMHSSRSVRWLITLWCSQSGSRRMDVGAQLTFSFLHIRAPSPWNGTAHS